MLPPPRRPLGNQEARSSPQTQTRTSCARSPANYFGDMRRKGEGADSCASQTRSTGGGCTGPTVSRPSLDDELRRIQELRIYRFGDAADTRLAACVSRAWCSASTGATTLP
jgi:hypothetical protein